MPSSQDTVAALPNNRYRSKAGMPQGALIRPMINTTRKNTGTSKGKNKANGNGK
jgi:hypothetical protein